METLGECTFLLSMRLVRDRTNKTLTLCQDKYINSILSEYGMADYRPTSTPMISTSHITPAPADGIFELKASGENYRRAVGLLNYLVL